MLAVDTNVLVHAHREDSPFHAAALHCVTTLAEGRSGWAIPWPCVHEFVAIATHPRIWAPPSTLAQAVAQIEAWLESPSLQLLSETEAHWPTLRALLLAGRIRGAMAHDARIVAMCQQHRVTELLTADRDFSRFARLTTRNPLLDHPRPTGKRRH